MPINQTNTAWRTKPCRFFADTGGCIKGAYCRFKHIDEDGTDLHASPHLNELDGVSWQEIHDPAGIQEGFKEVDLNLVGAKEEPCYEDYESLRLPPHFGIYPGIGS